MAQIYNYTSSKEIIERVYRDSGRQDVIDYDSCINWIYELMELIGAPAQYIPKFLDKTEDDTYSYSTFKIKLPCDFHSLIFTTVNGYAQVPSTPLNSYLDKNFCSDNSSIITYTDNFGNKFSPIVGNNPNGYTDYFSINGGYITYNIKSGDASIMYYAFPIDDKGFPLIPDVEKYKIALTKFIIMKLDYIGWRTGAISREVFQHSERESNWYIGSIASHLKIPDVQQMESIKNGLMRLKPNINEFNKFFSGFSSNKGIR